MKKNLRRWLPILGILILALSLAACGGDQQDRSGDQVSAAGSGTVNVTAGDFEFMIDAAQARAGTVTFVVKNDGHMPHDFSISGNGVNEKTPMIDPGETKTLTVDLQPGTFQYICTVPGHEMLGMKGTFTVTSN